MALAITGRINSKNTSPGTASWTTASFTPSNNSLLVAILSGVENSGTTDPSADFTISDSAGLTWTSRVNIGDTSTWTNGIRIWTAPVTTGTSMTITFDAGARNMAVFYGFVFDFTGYSTGTPTGGTASSASLNANGAANITLSAAPASGDYTIATCFVNNDNTNAVTPGTGWTELYEGSTAGQGGAQIQYLTGSTSTSVDWNDTSAGSTANKAVGAALVIKAGGATAYTLTCDPGSYTMTGTAATLRWIQKIAAVAGSFVMTGVDLVMRLAFKPILSPGSVTVTGTDANLTYTPPPGSGKYWWFY